MGGSQQNASGPKREKNSLQWQLSPKVKLALLKKKKKLMLEKHYFISGAQLQSSVVQLVSW